jgi:acid phosphatase
MRGERSCWIVVVGVIALLVGCGGHRPAPRAPAPTQPAAAPATTAAPAIPRDTHELLQGVLWMQKAAEYWALASTTYRQAGEALVAALADTSSTAATEQASGFERLPPAVVLDLDETVLDNSRFQGQLVLDRTVYEPSLWRTWVMTGRAGAIPGAADFLRLAAARGVTAFFVTNRTAGEQAATLANLQQAGIAASDETVLCTGEHGWTSDKTARRAEVAKTHRIVLMIGDDMNDFVSTAALSPDARVKLAMTYADRWGRQWFLLPNPMYGSWDRALYPGLTEDSEILRRKMELVDGFSR